MKFCRFSPLSSRQKSTASIKFGLIEGNSIREISAAPWKAWRTALRSFPLKDCRLAAPVLPSKIVCVGRNYAAHAAEFGHEMPKEPMIFLKPPSSVIGPGESIVLPKYSQRVEHEAELGLVIGKTCSHLKDDEDPLGYLLGYTCVNDVPRGTCRRAMCNSRVPRASTRSARSARTLRPNSIPTMCSWKPTSTVPRSNPVTHR